MSIYMWREPWPVTKAWIYYDTVNGIISLSSNWTTWYSIADRNLWASYAAISSYWKMFQWWNCYWLASSWSVTLHSWYQNASWYWPWNYFYFSKFCYLNGGFWDTSYNDNLWWWVTKTNAAAQWPCDSWYHIPFRQDWTNIKNVLTALSVPNNKVYQYLLLPYYQWYRNYTDWNIAWTYTGYYWTAEDTWNGTNYAYATAIDGSWWLSLNYVGYRAYWYNIRPFKNEPVQPYEDWTVLY